jgi:hypothetical protein
VNGPDGFILIVQQYTFKMGKLYHFKAVVTYVYQVNAHPAFSCFGNSFNQNGKPGTVNDSNIGQINIEIVSLV